MSSERRFTKEHEWLLVEDGVGTLGITDFAQDELGDVVFVELPTVGERVVAHDEIGSIESVKAVAELYTPVAGEIVAVNDDVGDRPELVNEDPLEGGWLVKIRLDDVEAASELLDASQYEELVAGLAQES